MAPPQQKQNIKRMKLKSLPNTSRQHSPSKNIAVPIPYNKKPEEAKKVSAHTTNPGSVRESQIFDPKEDKQLVNSEWVCFSLRIIRKQLRLNILENISIQSMSGIQESTQVKLI
jgi:hypothetical protein